MSTSREPFPSHSHGHQTAGTLHPLPHPHHPHHSVLCCYYFDWCLFFEYSPATDKKNNKEVDWVWSWPCCGTNMTNRMAEAQCVYDYVNVIINRKDCCANSLFSCVNAFDFDSISISCVFYYTFKGCGRMFRPCILTWSWLEQLSVTVLLVNVWLWSLKNSQVVLIHNHHISDRSLGFL